MLIRLSRCGLAFLAISSLTPLAQSSAQDSTDTAAPPAVRSKDELQDYIEDRSIQTRNKLPRERKVHDADPWKKHPPAWSIPDVTKDTHPYAHPSTPAPGGGHYPGGPTGQFGRPYYYTATSPDTSGTGAGSSPAGPGPLGGYSGYGDGGFEMPYGGPGSYPAVGGYPTTPSTINGLLAAQSPSNLHYDGVYGGGVPAAPAYGYGAYAPFAAGYPVAGYGGAAYAVPGYGGYGYGLGPAANGASYAALPGQLPGNPYYYHFGPGFYRQQEAGHYTFPYHSYRRPWYFPGHTSYNRDTNIPW